MKYAVRYLKNTFYPLDVADSFELSDGQMVIVRTEKGEEALKVFVVNSKIKELWEKSKQKPQPTSSIIYLISDAVLPCNDVLSVSSANGRFSTTIRASLNNFNCRIVSLIFSLSWPQPACTTIVLA